MDIDTLVRFTTQGMLLCMYISLPIVIVAALVGLGVSFLQAITSMQDQTLSHGVKLIAVTIAIVIAAPFSAAALLHFANEIMHTAVPQ
ncbi:MULTISPECIES: type III secretion system export apparatus subunit SctS [Burkholderiaceae]|jgi:type III secretion protein S|uniref:Surface presentation of antigens protein SpaQ n=3 Tax=Burkholderiaceae TaxID=119060 RepID=A0A6J5K0I7_9BURK|nr:MULTISPECIES: type III secretion system export apparatus subunit SctS [Burkholderiaceae]TGP46307.1 EscS/YscS/HrcS family type III secretion system export apparatus protein [bacterium M00.F.Ca.ET.228.01.1.1]TGS03779.1 EscS/YscS/HrcS family type III secretion system export apparatus protein [bacterium M00.F.Ca.ET.191.01.1.1]TGU07601.1 EscS/YscS/HrcS family type III secretion system export apparatus protein [bacterium M00.F.Ca.ET.155.01.1.1]CAH2775873.1 MAG: Type III secretion inner membrane pr